MIGSTSSRRSHISRTPRPSSTSRRPTCTSHTGGVAGYLPASGTFLPNPYGRLSNSFFGGDPNYNATTKNQYSIGYQFEHKTDEDWTLRQNTRVAHLDFASKATFGWYPGLASDDVSLSRLSGLAQATLTTFHVDNQAEKKISTGILDHTLLFGVDYQYQDTSVMKGYGSLPDLNIFNPVYFQSFVAPDYNDTRLQGNSSQAGIYAQDQIKLGRLTVVLGGREDFARTSQYEQVNDVTSKQNDSAFSGRVGAIYNFDSGFAPYYNYAQSFIPQIGVGPQRTGLQAADRHPERGRPQIPAAGLAQHVHGRGLRHQAAERPDGRSGQSALLRGGRRDPVARHRARGAGQPDRRPRPDGGRIPARR